jgi:hypothetical protein
MVGTAGHLVAFIKLTRDVISSYQSHNSYFEALQRRNKPFSKA